MRLKDSIFVTVGRSHLWSLFKKKAGKRSLGIIYHSITPFLLQAIFSDTNQNLAFFRNFITNSGLPNFTLLVFYDRVPNTTNFFASTWTVVL